MPESREMHRLRMQLKRSHPAWTNEQIRDEMLRVESSRKVHRSSQSVHKGSQDSQEVVDNSSLPSSSQKVHGSSRLQARTWIKLDHSIEKGQIILKESLDGVSWRTVTILRKGQAFERNNMVIIGTWHKGSEKEENR